MIQTKLSEIGFDRREQLKLEGALVWSIVSPNDVSVEQ